MPTVRISSEAKGEIAGVRFRTDAQPGTDDEVNLQEVQRRLAESSDLPRQPHLNFYDAAIVDGPDKTYISLWTPASLRSQATDLLRGAGFEVL